MGNQMMQNLLQAGVIRARLTVSAPDDPQEREADRLADDVMHDRPAGVGAAPRPATTAATTLPTPLSQTLGAGQPLDPASRAFFEPRFGQDFSHVRIHTDPQAAGAAQEIEARAFAVGQNVVFGAGEYAPQTARGRRLLAHELAHDAQQDSQAVPDAARLHRQPQQPTTVIFEGTAARQPLSRYSILRQGLDPAAWERLNNAALARESRRLGSFGSAISQSERDRLERAGSREVTLPLRALMRPEPRAEGGEDYRRTLFQLATGPMADPFSMSQVIQSELSRRWAQDNSGLLGSEVRVALIDPEGLAEGAAGLTFQVKGQPVSTPDGGLYLAQLDAIGSKTLNSLQTQVQDEVHEVERAATLALTAQRAVQQGRDVIRDGHSKISAQDLTAWTQTLNDLKAKLDTFRQEHGTVAGDLQTTANDLNQFISGEHTSFVTAHAQFLKEHMPSQSYAEASEARYDQDIKLQGEMLNKGGFAETLSAGYYGQAAYYEAMGRGGAAMVTAGYTETSGALHRAFREGKISLDAFEEGMSNAATRALIVGAITAALTIATFGLAGPVLGTSASLGQQVLYWGGTSALTTMSAMTAESLYTSSVTMHDPYVQQIWAQGQHTPGQIFLGGAISFGLGASGPLLGWLGGRGNAQAAQALVLASKSGQTTMPVLAAGLRARIVSPGVVEIVQEGAQSVLRLTEEGWELRMAAGSSRATVMSGKWVALEGATTPPQLSQAFPNIGSVRDVMAVQMGGRPFGAGVTGQGWFAYDPFSSSPYLGGLWGEGGALARPYGSGLALLLPGSSRLLSGASPLLLPSGIYPLNTPPSMLPLVIQQPAVPGLVTASMQRPEVGIGIADTAFEAQRQQYMAALAKQVPGPAGAATQQVEEFALASEWQFESTRRVMEPVFGARPAAAINRAVAAANAAGHPETGKALARQWNTTAEQMLADLRDTSRPLAERQSAALGKLSQLEQAIQKAGPLVDAAQLDFGQARTALSAMPAGSGVTLGDQGLLWRGNQRIGTMADLMDRVASVNELNRQNGINREFVISVPPAPRPGVQPEVSVLSRPFPVPPVPAVPRPAPFSLLGESHPPGFIVEMGSGESSFGLDMIAPQDRASTLLVQTEYGPQFIDRALRRRDLTWMNAVPRSDTRSVTLFGDPLQTTASLFGAGEAGRILINNINAYYTTEQYTQLARQLMRTLPRSGRVEVQWDMSPEKPLEMGGKIGDRGHITGPDLEAALNRVRGEFGRKFSVDTAPMPERAYPYSITPSSRIGGTTQGSGFISPVPQQRWIFIFE